jgi:hypothetical protein
MKVPIGKPHNKSISGGLLFLPNKFALEHGSLISPLSISTNRASYFYWPVQYRLVAFRFGVLRIFNHTTLKLGGAWPTQRHIEDTAFWVQRVFQFHQAHFKPCRLCADWLFLLFLENTNLNQVSVSSIPPLATPLRFWIDLSRRVYQFHHRGICSFGRETAITSPASGQVRISKFYLLALQLGAGRLIIDVCS